MQKNKNKRIIVSVTNDLVADNRVHRICTTLAKMGFHVLLVGRKLPESEPVNRNHYFTYRMKLFFRKGFLFYGEYNIRLFLFLIFKNADLFLANDTDTLPANYLISIIKRKHLIYDSHEFFTQVPELVTRPFIQRIWENIERLIIPKVSAAYTVCDSIAKNYTERFGIEFHVVRNLPYRQTFDFQNKDIKNRIILYQGAVNVHRGLETAIMAMKFIENAKLVIAGNGDVLYKLKELTNALQLHDRVEFAGRLPLEDLSKLTRSAALGISLEEDAGLNYRYALPNKLFDYIQAGIPVVVSNLPEMAAIIDKYNIGLIVQNRDETELAKTLNRALSDAQQRDIWIKNLKLAAMELVWENEEKKIKEIFMPFLRSDL